MAMPTFKEIEDWRRRLGERDFREPMTEFQDYLFKICEEYRLLVGVRYIRAVVPRYGLKTIEGIVEKVRRKRAKEDPDYNFNKIKDFAGLKIFCPYPSSAVAVCNWLLRQEQSFRLYPKTVEEAEEKKESGYRGYHFIATPNPKTHARWLFAKCEIQVKTMCMEAWDAMTHETLYKREELIDPLLQKHTKQLSEHLLAIDNQGELIKDQIERSELEDRARKEAAAISFFSIAMNLIKELEELYSFKLSSEDPREFTDEDCNNLKIAVGNYLQEFGLAEHLPHTAALLAVLRKEPEEEGLALRLAIEYAEVNPNDPRAEDTRASVYWGLNRLLLSIYSGQKALQKAESRKDDPRFCMNQLCYWVADALVAGESINEELLKQVIAFGKELERDYPEEPGCLDTVGFLRIVLGETAEDISHGLSLVKKSKKLAIESGDKSAIMYTETFGSRHERIAAIRLAEMVR